MDLKLLNAEPTDEERDAIDALLGAPESGWEGAERVDERDAHVAYGGHAARAQRHLLLPALLAVQERAGWISEGAFNYICTRLTVPPAEAWGVATFYALLATAPRPRRVLHVCDDIGCRYRGAREVMQALESRVGPSHAHGSTPNHVELRDDDATWLPSPCLGLCDHAPAALLTVAGSEPVELLLGDVTPDQAVALVTGASNASAAAEAGATRHPLPQQGDPSLALLSRVGKVDPTDLDAYRAAGGYEALRLAFEMGPVRVIREVTDSKLLGRGGAAFPTGRKWDAVARQPARPHFLVCNADESEPGTFKDRVLLEGDPFAIVEAMTIAAFATGCEQGFIYIRGEYPLAHERIRNAIEQARARGFLGESVMGHPFRFDIELRKGAGAYICGEETAIFNSIEGFRGEPRNKPPFPAEAGLFGKPTVINNVETLANVIPIMLHGGPAFASIGTEQSTGTRLFCLSGSVRRPGVYEVPFGATLRDLIELAGGVPEGRTMKAILLGGAAGTFVRPDEIDMPLTFEGVRAARATLGSGVIMIFDETADMRDALRRIAAFFRDESCGQCVPCRVGTVRQEEALHRIAARRTRGSEADELALLEEIGIVMKDASICGLGQTAYSAIESAIKRCGMFNAEAGR
ncbi:MAG TPA: NAD(P)H-dependent oxidoreductase subunit E [Gemmatimonadaceae bacterium]|nr:NAD(P)H-dependent oxidoreductase subunit E [Gemmatimonadaceae bacterium]